MNIRSKLRIRTRLRSALRRLRPPDPLPLVLMYHRICDEPVDPWQLAVSPARFEEQLAVLKRNHRPLLLDDFIARFHARTLPANAIAVTFDDGYVDNLTAAKPRLAAADVPAMVFLATGHVDRGDGFWWDELARLILAHDFPPRFDVQIGGKRQQFDFGSEAAGRDHAGMVAPSDWQRRDVLQALHQAIRPLDEAECASAISRLYAIFRAKPWMPARVMTSGEVRELTADGLVALGAHTVTHPVLSGKGVAACSREISESKIACERLVGKPVSMFAYPYGEFDGQAREAVKAAGLLCACSMRRGPITERTDVFALDRIHVPNLDGDQFEALLRDAFVQ